MSDERRLELLEEEMKDVRKLAAKVAAIDAKLIGIEASLLRVEAAVTKLPNNNGAMSKVLDILKIAVTALASAFAAVKMWGG